MKEAIIAGLFLLISIVALLTVAVMMEEGELSVENGTIVINNSGTPKILIKENNTLNDILNETAPFSCILKNSISAYIDQPIVTNNGYSVVLKRVHLEIEDNEMVVRADFIAANSTTNDTHSFSLKQNESISVFGGDVQIILEEVCTSCFVYNVTATGKAEIRISSMFCCGSKYSVLVNSTTCDNSWQCRSGNCCNLLHHVPYDFYLYDLGENFTIPMQLEVNYRADSCSKNITIYVSDGYSVCSNSTNDVTCDYMWREVDTFSLINAGPIGYTRTRTIPNLSNFRFAKIESPYKVELNCPVYDVGVNIYSCSD